MNYNEPKKTSRNDIKSNIGVIIAIILLIIAIININLTLLGFLFGGFISLHVSGLDASTALAFSYAITSVIALVLAIINCMKNGEWSLKIIIITVVSFILFRYGLEALGVLLNIIK